MTGFPYRFGHGLRILDEAQSKPFDQVRVDLIDQKRSQETLATCGLSSLVQVLNSRGIKISESDLMEKTELLGIKSKDDLFGINPGLEFPDFVRLAKELGKEYGFKVENRLFSSDGYAYFRSKVEAASRRKVDVILNYMSTEIGRPGAGHYSPVGGYNLLTGEILMSETNLAMNPPFWAKANSLFRAMKTKTDEVRRGYLVIHWHSTGSQLTHRFPY
jgi:glutathione gamma-glutamylcysteinyltransferase